MIVPPALLSRGQSEPLAESNAFLCLLLETANMRVDQNLTLVPASTDRSRREAGIADVAIGRGADFRSSANARLVPIYNLWWPAPITV